MKAKLSASHQTFTPVADLLRRHLARVPTVTKIGAGLIKPASGGAGPPRLKIKAESGALKVVVRGNRAVQDVRFYARDHTGTIVALREYARKMGWVVVDVS
jgi:hypothetical protein